MDQPDVNKVDEKPNTVEESKNALQKNDRELKSLIYRSRTLLKEIEDDEQRKKRGRRHSTRSR